MQRRTATATLTLAVVFVLALGLVACGGSDEVVQPDPLSHIPIFDDPDPEVDFTGRGDAAVGADDPFCVAVRERDAARPVGGTVRTEPNMRASMDDTLAALQELRPLAPNEDVGAALDVNIAAVSTVTALDLPTDVNQLVQEDPSGDRLAALVAEIYIAMLDPDVVAAAGPYVAYLNSSCGYALVTPPTNGPTREELAALRGMSLEQLGQALGE